MKMLVTGACGFIGSALVRELKAQGHEVISIDRHYGTEAVNMLSYLEDSHPDVVFHLAAQTSVWNEDWQQVIEDNIRQFAYVVMACQATSTRLVYASSSTANGSNGTTVYGMSKSFGERFASVYYPEATGVRLHNVYGPYSRPGTLPHCLIEGAEVTIYNQGRNTRHFTYIDDAVKGLIAAIYSKLPLVNVCNPEELSIWDFACEVQRRKPTLKLTLVPNERAYDNPTQAIDYSIPTIPLDYTSVEEGLAKVFDIRD